MSTRRDAEHPLDDMARAAFHVWALEEASRVSWYGLSVRERQTWRMVVDMVLMMTPAHIEALDRIKDLVDACRSEAESPVDHARENISEWLNGEKLHE